MPQQIVVDPSEVKPAPIQVDPSEVSQVDPADVTIAPDPAAVAALERGPGIPLYQVAPGRPQKELPPIGAKGKDLGRFSGDYSLGQNVQSGYQSGLAGVDRLIANISGLAEASATDYPMLSLGGAEIYKHIGNWARDQQKYREEKAAEYAGGRQDLPSKVIRGATSAVTSLPITAAATTLGGPVLGMAGLGALETADQGDWNMLKGAAEGAAMGKFMHVLSPAGRVLRVPIVAAAEYAKNVAQGVDHETALANALNMAGLSAVGGPGEVSARDLPAHMLESLKPNLAVKSVLNPVEQSAIDYLREKNVPLTPGTITGNRYLRANEAVVKTSPLGQQTAADFNRGTTEGIQRVAGELSNQVYPQPETPESAGQAVTGKLQKNIKDLGLTEDEAYQDAWTGRGEDKYTENVPVRMRKVAETDDAGKPTGRMIDQPVMAKVNMPVDVRDLKAQAEPIFEEMQWMPAAERATNAGYAALEKLIEGDDFIPAWAAEKGLSGLKTMARVTNKSGVRDVGQGIAAGLIPDLQRGIDAAVAKTGGTAIQGLMRGRATHASKMDVADLADQLRTEPVQAFNQMVWQHDTGIGFLRKIEEQTPEQMPQIARAWVQQQFEKASEEGGFTKTGGILKQWRNLGPETQKIFFPDRAVRESLGHLFKGADMVQFNPNTSGTELLRQATSTNPLRWVAGYLGSKLFYTPTGIALLTEKLRPRMGPQPAPASAAPTEGGPPSTPPEEGAPPAGQGGGIRQKLQEGLKRVVEEEEGSLKIPQWIPGKTKLADINEDFVVPAAGKQLQKEDVMQYLQRQVQQHLGAIDPDAGPKTKFQRLLKLGRTELRDQLSQPDPKLDFYLADTPQANADMIQMFPEVGTDSEKMTLLKAASAVLAQGANPEAEAMNGGRAYAYYRQHGRLPSVQPDDGIPGQNPGKQWSTTSGSDPIIKLQGFIDSFKSRQDPTGLIGLERILTGRYPVGYLKHFNANVEGPAGKLVPGAMILGPKIGSYFLDISGIPQKGTTVDMWDTLANHRRMGYLFTDAGKPITAPQKITDRQLFQDLHGKLEDEFSLKRTQAQSGLWHYEKDLYRLLGVPTPVKGRSDGTKRLLDAWGHQRQNVITPQNAPPAPSPGNYIAPQIP